MEGQGLLRNVMHAKGAPWLNLFDAWCSLSAPECLWLCVCPHSETSWCACWTDELCTGEAHLLHYLLKASKGVGFGVYSPRPGPKPRLLRKQDLREGDLLSAPPCVLATGARRAKLAMGRTFLTTNSRIAGTNREATPIPQLVTRRITTAVA